MLLTSLMVSKLRRNQFPVRKTDSNLLVITSCFFLIPGYYAFTIRFYYYAVLSFITTAVSINYWRHAADDYCRTSDMIIARLSFTIYFLYGCLFLKDSNLLVIGIVGCLSIMLSYALSTRYWYRDESIWVVYHMLFHLSVACEQFLVLYTA